MDITFYIAAAVATAATIMVVVSTNAIHALLHLIVSLLGVAVIFFVLGAPFAAALEVIIYAGAIMVLFVFVVMMLNVGDAIAQEKRWLSPSIWIGPGILSAILLAELVRVLLIGDTLSAPSAGTIEAKPVGAALYGPYLLAVELASMLLLSGLVGAYHIARREREEERY